MAVSGPCHRVGRQNKIKWKKKKTTDKHLDLASELKSMEHESEGDITSNWRGGS